MKWGLVAGGMALAAVVAWIALSRSPSRPAPPAAPTPRKAATYVGSETCARCHQDRHATWMETGHAYSLRRPTPKVVKGSFDGKPIESTSFTATPYRKNGKYFIRVEGRGRPSGDYEVTRVVGRTFEQAYLFTGPSGAWRVLPICWSLERGTWDKTHLVLADIAGETGYPRDYDTRARAFNTGCGQCHATGYDIGYDETRDRYHSTMVEGAVACETCHGPGSAHVEWREGKRRKGTAYAPPARLLNPRRNLDAQQVLGSCGRCHYSHEWQFAIGKDPAADFHDIAVTTNLDPPQPPGRGEAVSGFFADGRLDGLRYQGSTQSQSACFRKGGMSCLSCHDPHGGKRWMLRFPPDSDAQCAQCHRSIAKSGRAHTHHDSVRCVDCHMPRFLKGTLHTMRDHSIRSPEPELTERFGAGQAPNACNECHADKTAKWARLHKQDWWGPAPRRLVEDTGLVVALRRRAEVSTEALVKTAERRESRRFFRLTALRQLSDRGGDEARRAVRRLLLDPDPDVRQVAVSDVLARLDREAAPALQTLLSDRFRTIRVDAAYALAQMGWRGKDPAFERAYQDARKMLVRQRHFEPFLLRVAFLADALGRAEESREALDELLRTETWPADRWPEEVYALLHRRGRDLAEAGHPQEALAIYERSKIPGETSISLMLLLDTADALASVGRAADAQRIWKVIVQKGAPARPAVAIARARLDAAHGRRDEAVAALRALARVHETDPVAGELLRRIRWSLAAVRRA